MRRTLGLGGRLVDYAAQAGTEDAGPACGASGKPNRERPTLLAKLAALLGGDGPRPEDERTDARRFRERANVLRRPAGTEAAG